MNPSSFKLEDLVKEQFSRIKKIAADSISEKYVSAHRIPFDSENASVTYSEARLLNKSRGHFYMLYMWEQLANPALSQRVLGFQRLVEEVIITLHSAPQQSPEHVFMQVPTQKFRLSTDSLPEVMVVGYTPKTEDAPPLLHSIILPRGDGTAMALVFRYRADDSKVSKAKPAIKAPPAIWHDPPEFQYESVLQNPDILVDGLPAIARILGMRPGSAKQNLSRRYPWLFVDKEKTTLGLLERLARLPARNLYTPQPPETRQRIVDGILYRLKRYEERMLATSERNQV